MDPARQIAVCYGRSTQNTPTWIQSTLQAGCRKRPAGGMCGASSKSLADRSGCRWEPRARPPIFCPTGLDPEVLSARSAVTHRRHCNPPNGLSSPAPGPAGRRKQLRRSFVSFVDTQEPLYICWCLHKWSQQSSGLCKQHFRDSFSRMTVPQGRDGSLLGFAFEN